jgi:hypothetical protein
MEGHGPRTENIAIYATAHDANWQNVSQAPQRNAKCENGLLRAGEFQYNGEALRYVALYSEVRT